MKRGFASFTFCFAIATVAAAPVRADILFLDLNNNPEEVEVAKRAADKLGEKIWIHPTLTEQLRTDIANVRKPWMKAEFAMRRQCEKPNNEEACGKAKEAYAVLDKAYDKVTNPVDLDEEGLEKILAKHKREGHKFTKLIISGHWENGKHFGEFGDLPFADLKKAFKKYGSCDTIEALYPFGCTTISQKGIMAEPWKKICPNLALTAAYNGQSPLGHMKANLGYLESILLKTDEILKAKDAKEAQDIFKTVDYVNNAQIGLKAGICLNSDVIITKDGITSMSEMQQNCSAIRNDDLDAKYLCYRDAAPGCEDLPPRTNAGPLRDYYNYLSNTFVCNKELAKQGQLRPPAEQVLRLVFNRNVRNNFEVMNKAELTKLNATIEAMGLPANLKLENLGKITRKEYLEKLRGLELAYGTRYNRQRDRHDDIDDPDTATLGFALQELKKVEDPRCVPEDWLEQSGRGPDKCSITAGLRAAEKSAQSYTDQVYRRRVREGYYPRR